MVRRMPAKPLTEDQMRDAQRLRQAYELWKSSRAESGLSTAQDQVAELFGMGQSALSQYLNGKIPLNAEALQRFCSVLGVRAANISPTVVAHQRQLLTQLEADPSGGPEQPLNATPAADPQKIEAAPGGTAVLPHDVAALLKLALALEPEDVAKLRDAADALIPQVQVVPRRGSTADTPRT